jgi:hypothetical protein
MIRSRSPIALSSFFLLAFCSVIASCHHKAVSIYGGHFPPVAATDDTVQNYAIALFRDHRFAFTITHANQRPVIREYYHGAWLYRSDTLVLHYHQKGPEGMANYLVKEITGGWLIQVFTDGRSRIFLRVRYPPAP